LDEETLKSIAARTVAKYFKAEGETELYQIYADLGKQIIFEKEETELTAIFTGVAAILITLAGIMSLLWLNQLP
jgi:Ca-activated chloride channel family protein